MPALSYYHKKVKPNGQTHEDFAKVSAVLPFLWIRLGWFVVIIKTNKQTNKQTTLENAYYDTLSDTHTQPHTQSAPREHCNFGVIKTAVAAA